MACSLVEVGPVIWALDMDPPHSLDPLSLSLLVLVQVMRASSCPARGLQECIVRSSAVLGLIQQDIQGLLINAGFGELNLCPHKIHGKKVSKLHMAITPDCILSRASGSLWCTPVCPPLSYALASSRLMAVSRACPQVTSSLWQGWGVGVWLVGAVV